MAKKILSDVSEMEQVFNKQFFGFPMKFSCGISSFKGLSNALVFAWNTFSMLQNAIRNLIFKKSNFLLFILVNLGTIN